MEFGRKKTPSPRIRRKSRDRIFFFVPIYKIRFELNTQQTTVEIAMSK